MFLKNNLHFTPWLIDTFICIEEQDPTNKLQINIGGVRELGKTTGVLQIFRHIASKQHPNKQKVRRLKIGLLRESYRDFNQIIDTFSEWYDVVNSYDAVFRERSMGFAYKNIDKAPQLVIFEKNPDMLSLMLGEDYRWDGTYCKIIIEGFSYNKPDADNHIRGQNLGCAWVNESQTIPEKPVSTLIGSYARPAGKIVNPIMIQDYNLPEAKDKGYDRLRRLIQYNNGVDPKHKVNIYFPPLPAPYSFEKDPEGDFEYEGHMGFLVKNQDFLKNAPPGKTFDGFDEYKTMGDDEVRRNMLGLFGRKTQGKLIYNEFDPEKHVRHVELPNKHEHPNHLILAPIDFGIRPGVLLGYVNHGVPVVFKEFAIDQISFYDLMTTYLIPYFERHLPYYYERDQIVFIGDPTSGAQRQSMKFAQPVNVLLGVTDINGDEDGDGVRFHFERTMPSPCGNVIEHRLNVSKSYLARQNGLYLSDDCKMTREMFEEEYVEGSNGNPLKKTNNLHHALADCYQYFSAYLYAGFETEIAERKPKKKRAQHRKKKKYV